MTAINKVFGFIRGSVWTVALALLFNGCAHTHAPLARFEYREIHMGVQVRLVVFAPNEETARRACRAAFARVEELDKIMSDWQVDSELARLNAAAGGPPIRVSDDLFRVLQHAQEVTEKSDGAFDVTIGPLVKLWRETRKTKQLPSPDALTKARTLVGWRKMILDAKRKTVLLTERSMRLDLGGIAKGYAGDCALAVLRQHGIRRALFEAGGDIVLGDPPPGPVAAVYDRRNPDANKAGAHRAPLQGWIIKLFDTGEIITLANCAVSTSGDTEQFVEISGVRYSHIVDPSTGHGLTNQLAVTVIARNGLTSDPLSTAISVLGDERGSALAKKFEVKIYLRR